MSSCQDEVPHTRTQNNIQVQKSAAPSCFHMHVSRCLNCPFKILRKDLRHSGFPLEATPPASSLEATLGLLSVTADATHLAEGLSAARAAVGFLLRVHGAMALQVAGRDEALPAQRAVVAPLPGVDEQVHPQVVGLGEALPTMGAGEGPLARVDAPVQLQRS